MADDTGAAAAVAAAIANGYARFDSKFEGMERDLKNDIAGYRSESNKSFSEFRSDIRSDIESLRTLMSEVLSKLGAANVANNRPFTVGSSGKEGLGNTNTFVIIAATIILPLCGLGAYVVGNLDTKFSKAVDTNAHDIEVEKQARTDSTRVMYEKTWPKEAQIEYEKRVDERNGLEAHFQDEVNTQVINEIKTVVAQMVPRAEHEQRWTDQKEQITTLEHSLSESLNRLAEHVNAGDKTVADKFSDVDKSLHGYGIADEMKDIQNQLRDAQDRIFHLATPTDKTGPRGATN